jgi:DNA-binding response OmpR family regulator
MAVAETRVGRNEEVCPVALVVEDQPELCDVLAGILGELGCEALTVHSGAEGLKLASNLRPDLVLLDLRLPDVDGMFLCQQFASVQGLAVIVITSVDDGDIAERALSLGARDYVRKPFHLNELRARVRAVLLRETGAVPGQCVRIGRLQLDYARCEARVDGRPVNLSATEWRLLSFLAEHPGWVFSKERLLEALWPNDRDAHAVQVHISNLRRKIEDDPRHPTLLLTVKGLGYKLEPGGAPRSKRNAVSIRLDLE